MKFQVGDRVRCFGFSGNQASMCRPLNAKIIRFSQDHIAVEVHFDNGGQMWVHTKALRKLAKRERRRVWLNPEYFELIAQQYRNNSIRTNEAPEGWLEFIEVRRPKK